VSDPRIGIGDHQSHCITGPAAYGHGFTECPCLVWSADGNTARCAVFKNKDGTFPKLAFGRGCYHIRCRQCRQTPIGMHRSPE
jgi:hypothetical protein